MRYLNRLLWLGVVAMLLPGCATTSLTTVTNLTPTRLPRKDNGQYMFSVEFRTRQSTLIQDTLKAYVIVGEERYEMARTPLLKERWETLVPVPRTEGVLNYRYRFEYMYKAMPKHEAGLFDTKGYQLFIQDR